MSQENSSVLIVEGEDNLSTPPRAPEAPSQPTLPEATRAQSLCAATFPGNGEMNDRCRHLDWAATALGPVDGWSQSLRTTVATVLKSRNPMFLFWGPELTQFYNDAYRPSLGQGGREEIALGARGREFWTDIWHAIGPELEQVMTTGEPTWHEDQFLPIERNGSLDDAWWTYSYSPVYDDDGTIGGALVVCLETTGRVLAERESARLLASLEAERSRLSSVFELAPAFLAILRGANHVFELANPAYMQLVGPRDLMGKSVADALPELRDQGFIELLNRVRETGEPFVGTQMAVRLERVPGEPLETRYVDFVYQRATDANSEYTLIAHGVDVTAQVNSTRSLKQVELRLRDQFSKLPVPTFLWEERGDDFLLIDRNDAAGRVFPAFEDAVGKMGSDLFPSARLTKADLHRCLREDVVITETRSGNGVAGTRTFEFTMGPQQPNRVLLHAVEITRRMELEEELRQAHKMEAVGRLAGGIAHDFNNLLTVIGGHSAFLMESLGPDDPRHAEAEEIQKAGIRASGLTRQLLAFSNKQILKPEKLALNEIVEETQNMLARLLGENIEIVARLEPDLGCVLGDASQMSQILMNLSVNARDAMENGGRLTIATRNVTVDDSSTDVPAGISSGQFVVLQVSDTGVGMDSATQARLFEPFFTTKVQGKGTGLGLATVYGIVTQSSGHIMVDSTVGVGSTFTMYLPRINENETCGVTEPVVNTPARAEETILLVEDEPGVREIARRLLERQGYKVLVAENGPQALAISDSWEASIDLVISDAVMPGMSGGEVVRQLSERRPNVKVLFISGYTDDDILRSGIVTSSVKFLQKPFALAAFGEAVRDALES